MVFDPKKHRGNGAVTTEQAQQQPEQPQEMEDTQTWGYLDENAPEMPDEWLNNQAPPPATWELEEHYARSEELSDEEPQPEPQTQQAEPAKITGYIQNPTPSIADPFVEYLFNMKTINEINAGPGVGKTTLLSMLAACVATGKPFLDRFRVKQGISVFFTEDAETVINCLSAWQLEWGVNILDHVLIYDKPAALTDVITHDLTSGALLTQPRWGERALRQIREIKDFAGDRRVCMVVYDSKSFHLSSAQRNGKALEENSNDDQQYITFCGYRFSRALQACGIFIPHVSKEAERSPHLVLESRGGGAAKGAVWKTFSLTADKVDPNRVIMASGKRRGGGIAQLLRLTRQSMPIFAEEEAKAYRAAYEAAFSESIPPASTDDNLKPIDPLMTGGYLNECEIVTEEQLAEELAAKLKDDKGGDKKKDPRLARPSTVEQEIIDLLMERGGQMTQRELVTEAAERYRKTKYQIGRALTNAIGKQLLREFEQPGGEVIITAQEASPPPLNQR